MNTLLDTIDTMSQEQLKEVVARVKERCDILTRRETRQYRVGDRVTFRDKSDRSLTGTVRKLNRKSINVQVDGDSRFWRVHPSFLSLIEEESND